MKETQLAAPVVSPDVDGLRVPERTLMLLRDLVSSHAGMHYGDERLSFMRDRLVPLAIDRGFDSLLDYYYLLKYDSQADEEWVRAIDALSVQETYFWREPDQLRSLAKLMIPRLLEAGRRSIRIWSVPCASGEEPLSLAMALEEAGWFDRVPIEIHAGDASDAALRKAAAGRYGPRAFRQLPEAMREKYFDADDDGAWVIKPGIKARVTSWSRTNVVRPDHIARFGLTDVIFCRNLFIYFTPATIRQVAEQFAAILSKPGFLCIGAAESLLRVTPRFDLQDIGGAYVYVKS